MRSTLSCRTPFIKNLIIPGSSKRISLGLDPELRSKIPEPVSSNSIASGYTPRLLRLSKNPLGEKFGVNKTKNVYVCSWVTDLWCALFTILIRMLISGLVFTMRTARRGLFVVPFGIYWKLYGGIGLTAPLIITIIYIQSTD